MVIQEVTLNQIWAKVRFIFEWKASSNDSKVKSNGLKISDAISYAIIAGAGDRHVSAFSSCGISIVEKSFVLLKVCRLNGLALVRNSVVLSMVNLDSAVCLAGLRLAYS